MSALRSPHTDPAQPTLRQRGADLKAGIARVLRREKPDEPAATPAAADPQDVFDGIAASTREAAADALTDDRVSPELRAAVETHRDATVAMLLEPDTSNEATEVRCAAVEASGKALRAVPARSIADVRAKLAFLLPEILPDVNGETPTAFLENIFDDVERLAASPAAEADPVLAAIAASCRAEAEMKAFGDEPRATTRRGWAKREQALTEAQTRTRLAVWDTVPTTTSGRLALVEYARFQRDVLCTPAAEYGSVLNLLDEILTAFGTAVRAERPETLTTIVPGRPNLTPDRAWAVAQAAAIDLSGPTLHQLGNLFGVFAETADHWLDIVHAPWTDQDPDSPYHCPNAAGRIIEREQDRLAEIRTRVAEEIRRRVPSDERERDHRLEMLIRYELMCETSLRHAPELRAEIAAAWGA